jgi:ribosome-binding protein aMBF1 (putative translation factor)
MKSQKKRSHGVSLETIIEKQRKDSAFSILFDERRFYLQIAHMIADLRAKAGLSQAELAKAAKVSQPLIARLERGDQRRAPTFDTIYKLLKVLGYRLELMVKPEKVAA